MDAAYEKEMSATNFKTENNTYRKLIGNGLTYRIPRFQRDYSWTEDEWEDLWLDILGTGEPAHYMGYLVLQSQDDKNFDVIDGQQRLTTLTLIVLAILKNLKRLVDEKNNPEHNQQRIEQIRQTYIGYLDPVTLVSRSKLTLNRKTIIIFKRTWCRWGICRSAVFVLPSTACARRLNGLINAYVSTPKNQAVTKVSRWLVWLRR